VPNIVVAVLVIHHVVEAMIVRRSLWPFMVDHPWFLFTATVTLVLSGFHVVVYIVTLLGSRARTTWGFQTLYPFVSGESMSQKRVELFLLVLDGEWSLLWVLQLFVQLLLPREHRVYATKTVYSLLALYGVQVLLAIPLVAKLYVDYETLIASLRCVPVSSAPVHPPACLHRFGNGTGNGSAAGLSVAGRNPPPRRGERHERVRGLG
jgi:hypothetical protein